MGRHLLGALGVLAAGVLLAVSAAMNWSFGYSLGRTHFDGQIYGAASVAADCMKALVPFFFFSAIRNRMWAQAAASALVMAVVTTYSLTSALGHAMLNRADTAGQRTHAASSYADMRKDLDRDRATLSAIPQHRPAATVQAEFDGMKTKREWDWSAGCTDIKSRTTRDYCQQVHALLSERASADQAATIEARIADNQGKLVNMQGGARTSHADPQAAVLAQVVAMTGYSPRVEDVQMGMTIMIALLLEIGSSLGLFIAFSQWREDDVAPPAPPAMVQVSALSVEPAIALPSPANENTGRPARMIPEETDVQLYYRDRVSPEYGGTVSVSQLYESYCVWCDQAGKEPLSLPTFNREFAELGVVKAKVEGRICFIGISVATSDATEADKKSPAPLGKRA